MKKLSMHVCLLAFTIFVTSCGGGGTETTSTDSSSNTTMGPTNDTSTDASTANGMSSQPDTSMAADREFVLEAASGGLMEVELGKLAKTNASAAAVKQFGQMMVTDHTKANAELKSVASAKNLTIPATPMEKHQAHIDELKSKKGAEFDEAYVDMMVKDHQEDIEKFEKEANDGNDADVKAFASKTLPVLKKHHESIQKIQEGMKK